MMWLVNFHILLFISFWGLFFRLEPKSRVMTRRLESFGFFKWLIDDWSHFAKDSSLRTRVFLHNIMQLIKKSCNLFKNYTTYQKITQPMQSLLPEIHYWMTCDSWVRVFFPWIWQKTHNDSSLFPKNEVVTSALRSGKKLPDRNLWSRFVLNYWEGR